MAPAGTQETICRIVEEYSDMLLRLACTRLDSTQDEKEKFTEVYEQYQHFCWYVANQMLGDDHLAEDAVQEVFLSLLTSKPVFRDAGHEKAWLIRATLHRASDIRRRAEKRNVPLETAENSPAREEGGELLAAVRALPQKYSSVIHLHYYEGYSIQEISKLLGLPAPTVGTRLARGRERLRQMLKEEA